MPARFFKSTIRPMALDLFRNIGSGKDDGMLVANQIVMKIGKWTGRGVQG